MAGSSRILGITRRKRVFGPVTGATGLSQMVNFYPTLRFHQHLFRDLRSATRTMPDLAQHEFIRSALIENIGENPIERKLRLIAAAMLASGNPALGFQDGLRIDSD